MGKLLNPKNQKMYSMILDMPRVWRLNFWVRGVVLSQESFQYICHRFNDDNNNFKESFVIIFNKICLLL